MSSTNLTRNGLADWLVQRFSAVILLTFILCITGFLIYNPHPTYADWSGYFGHIVIKIFTFIALLALLGHIWVGMWTVITDYIQSTPLRIFKYSMLAIFVLSILFWVGLIILSL